jgi:hypothetical protein
MSLSAIGENGANEFFETIMYQTAYAEANNVIKDFTDDVESSIIKDAMSGAMTIVAMGVVFELIRKQEQFIQTVFSVAEGLVVLLLASDFFQKGKNRIMGKLKGFKALQKFTIFQKSFSDRVQVARLVVDGAKGHFEAERTTQGETNTLDTVTNLKSGIVEKERLKMELGGSMATRYNETLLFKLFTKNFTSNDEVVLKKILGKQNVENLDVTEINQVADFMFVKDANGNLTGLSEQFFQLLNGLGYVHK